MPMSDLVWSTVRHDGRTIAVEVTGSSRRLTCRSHEHWSGHHLWEKCRARGLIVRLRKSATPNVSRNKGERK